jgi:glycine/D-amino acid oxidase-like deaminating enzyme
MDGLLPGRMLCLTLSVVILEKEFVEFGASGRNGGWLPGEPAGQFDRYSNSHGRDQAPQLPRLVFSTYDEMPEVAS